jgi:hypothetical protein
MARAEGKTPWEMKRSTAFFRGSGTGGGNTPDDNQRLKLHQLSLEWAKDARYNGRNLLDGVPFMDAAVSPVSQSVVRGRGEGRNLSTGIG